METATNEYQAALLDSLILIVDDNSDSQYLMELIFSDVGAKVLSASNGREALEHLREKNLKVDLVITDFQMPEMDGIELTRRIRNEEKWKQIPIILVSALSPTETLTKGLEVGANDYIHKPVNQVELIARSCSMLRQKKVLDSYLELQKLLELKIVERTVDLELTRDATLLGFAKLAESRDPETGAHLERIREFTRLLATKLSRSGPYRERVDHGFILNIYRSSPLHDIGKVAIRDAILLKPGPLTEQEFEIMKTHAAAGAETLQKASERLMGDSFLEMAREIAYCHHERWDGKGYPNGIKGEEIPLAARIMAVADVYDALSSKRVYKRAMPFEEVDKIIRSSSGTHFDPAIVQAYSDAADEFRKIRERFRDEE